LVASLLSVALVAAARPARACGPDFPPALFVDRASTLAELPDGSFALEAMRLLPAPRDRFRAVEGDEPKDARSEGLPRERALYAAGARAFHRGARDVAADRFRALLALPAAERRRFSTLAAFMLGRIQLDDAVAAFPERSAGSLDEARRRFGEVRELARRGFDDRLGLAVASLGDEARLLLLHDDDVGAIRLYAEQAAFGSRSAATSLLFVSRALVRDESRLLRALRDPLAQRLLAAYAWTRGQDHWLEGKQAREPGPRLLDQLAAVPGLAGGDRLAAAAWRAGRFDLAERFSSRSHTPLATWVRAKLAVRRGDRPAADRLLAEAATGFSRDEHWSRESMLFPQRPRLRLAAERALLALSRRDFGAAMGQALASCSWPDIAYVAERVLTLEELEAEVASGRVARASRLCPRDAGRDEDRGWSWLWAAGAAGLESSIRDLLARRLLRAGRREALSHFTRPAAFEQARRYLAALARVERARSDLERAEALWSAAQIARRHGLEILGTEIAPDWAWVSGDFDVGEYFRASKESALVCDAERARVSAHVPRPAGRFHYRFLASDLSLAAATLVPQRSQAYASLLCHAARFVRGVDSERAAALWRTYVAKGAQIREPMLFGETCPSPDFAGAGARFGARARLERWWKHQSRRKLAMLAAAVLVPLLLGAGAILLRRRRSRPVGCNRSRLR
jgi:hypothetical protein